MANGSKIQNLEGRKNTCKANNGSTQSMNFRDAGETKALASVNQICQGHNRVAFDEEGSYIENEASGRKVPMREENGVYVIDVHFKELIDTRGQVFVVPGERR